MEPSDRSGLGDPQNIVIFRQSNYDYLYYEKNISPYRFF